MPIQGTKWYKTLKQPINTDKTKEYKKLTEHRNNKEEAIYKTQGTETQPTKGHRTIESYSFSEEKKEQAQRKEKKNTGTPYFIRNYYRQFRWKNGLKNYRPSDSWHIAAVADFQLGKAAKAYAHLTAAALGYQLVHRNNVTDWQARKLPRLKIHGLSYRLVKILIKRDTSIRGHTT